LTEKDQIRQVNTGGKGRMSGWLATPPLQWGGAPALPNFGVPFYLCTHPLTQHYQTWLETYGEEAWF